MLKIALPNKGSLSDGAVSVVSEAGYDCKRSGKELEKTDAANGVEFFFLRPRDIATYVARGVIDLGITGRDLNEDAQTPALEVLPLGFGKSSFRYAVPAGSGLTPDTLGGKRVACSYRNIVERDLGRRGVEATVVRVDGAVEVSVKLGVADAVADVVESGATLRSAGLEPVGEPVMRTMGSSSGSSATSLGLCTYCSYRLAQSLWKRVFLSVLMYFCAASISPFTKEHLAMSFSFSTLHPYSTPSSMHHL